MNKENNYLDERTEQILKIISNDEGYNSKEIFELELTTYDCFRLYNLFTNYYSNKEGLPANSIIANHQKDVLKNSKMFTITPAIKSLLLKIVPAKIKEELKLPFNSLFIDTDFFIPEEDMRIFGVYLELPSKPEDLENLTTKIEEHQDFSEKEKGVIKTMYDIAKDGCIVQCSALLYAKEKEGFVFADFPYNLSTGKIFSTRIKIMGSKPDKYQKIVEKKISLFISNLLNFLNEPRVVLYIQETNNQRREKKGLIPIPSLLKTKIHIDLENYIEKIYFNGLSHSKLGFSFWVRGHWRRLLSPRFVNKQGQKIWIPQHISGEGLMPPQIFEITK